MDLSSLQNFIHPQFLSIICAFLDCDDNTIKFKLQKLRFATFAERILPLTIKYPYYDTIVKDSIKYTRCNGIIHSRNDEPAVIYPSGDKEWYRYGKLHRDGDEPAVIKLG